ncbi:Ppx/GppA phosphatase family protein [Kineosporia sp. NBRC 101731]|uniref:Ppx/GppA phosphatase family protein n=1 Tax=Kineosporia sp. NBRC 101731 TaxID=3032199 RepID=UPI0025555BE2|nr:Ppx/GppA phosphatase family protein [Kineosporia sp. NBRC 101731]
MRLGVLDVGSNTVHLLVVDAHPGARPLPASSHKAELRLAEQLDEDGRISPAAEKSLLAFVESSLTVGEDLGVEEVIGFATSAIRDAPNGEALLTRVRQETGVDLRVLAGGDEARLTFLAVRRWFGWSAGRLLVLDIGGGSLEIASGLDELPDVAISLPLGAGRLTRDRLAGDPPGADQVRAARKYARAAIGRVVRDVVRGGAPDQTVGSSKTFRTLARICGPADAQTPARTLRRADLTQWVPRLAAMTEIQRAELPGVSAGRARQILAGALVAEAAMELLGVESMQISPWALREGVILRRLDDVMSAAGPGI